MKGVFVTVTLLGFTTLIAGCATIDCPKGSLPIFGQNINEACSGKIGVSLTDKDGTLAGECKSKGPKVAMCVRTDWCNDGNSTITPEKISCDKSAAPSAPKVTFTACPGNVLTGEHRPRGSEKWFWTLDTKANIAKIQKPGAEVTGKVDMICDNGKWSAHLFDMTHGVKYNCNGSIEGDAIKNATCNANQPPVIDVTGIFTTRN